MVQAGEAGLAGEERRQPHQVAAVAAAVGFRWAHQLEGEEEAAVAQSRMAVAEEEQLGRL